MKDQLSKSDLNKLSTKAAVEQSSILVKTSEDPEEECAYCLRRGNRTELYIDAQAVNISVIAAETARNNIGPHFFVSSCANLSNVSKYTKLTVIKFILYTELCACLKTIT